MSNKEGKRGVYRVTRFPDDNEMMKILEKSRNTGDNAEGKTPEIFKIPVYDVYQDGSFHFLDPQTGAPTKEPEEWIQERTKSREAIETERRLDPRCGFARSLEGNDEKTASHEKYDKAFTTLCRLGFAPDYLAFSPFADRCSYEIEYFGEGEPWITVEEYNDRYGLEDVT